MSIPFDVLVVDLHPLAKFLNGTVGEWAEFYAKHGTGKEFGFDIRTPGGGGWVVTPGRGIRMGPGSSGSRLLEMTLKHPLGEYLDRQYSYDYFVHRMHEHLEAEHSSKFAAPFIRLLRGHDCQRPVGCILCREEKETRPADRGDSPRFAVTPAYENDCWMAAWNSEEYRFIGGSRHHNSSRIIPIP